MGLFSRQTDHPVVSLLVSDAGALDPEDARWWVTTVRSHGTRPRTNKGTKK